VCAKRVARGASVVSVQSYLKHLEEGVWENTPEVLAGIKVIGGELVD
jgi:hypothetical protein